MVGYSSPLAPSSCAGDAPLADLSAMPLPSAAIAATGACATMVRKLRLSGAAWDLVVSLCPLASPLAWRSKGPGRGEVTCSIKTTARQQPPTSAAARLSTAILASA